MHRLVVGPATTCPFQALEEPIAIDVIKVHRWFASGQVALRLGDDPPSFLIEGLEVFEGAYDRAETDRIRREDQPAGLPPQR